MKILLVDDHPVVLDGMRKMLSQMFPSDEIEVSSSGNASLALAKAWQPDFVILDIRLPDASGVEICQKIKSHTPGIKVMLFSGSPGHIQKKSLIQCGADGWLSKNSPSEMIFEAIQRIAEGGTYFAETEFAITGDGDEIFISPREKEVLKLIAGGLVNKEIAEKLYISVTTVDSHRKNLLLKFNVSNTAALISEAYKRGLLGVGG